MTATREPSAYAGRVLAVVEAIPAGKVMSYGDVAEYLGQSSARAVGRVLAHYGALVPWQRVVMASGAPAPHHAAEQLALLAAAGTPLSRSGRQVDMTAARWDGRSAPRSAPRSAAEPESSDARGPMRV